MAGVGADGSIGISRNELRASEVAQRVREGRVNGTPPRSTRSVIAILRANALTRFNLLLVGLFGATLAVRASKDTLFIWVVVLNLVVGVAQELRARRTLDRLNVLDTVPVRVRRDGEEQHVPPEEVVEDDIVVVSRGDQVAVDAMVQESVGLEIDESLITGEADPVPKPVGACVLSGSVVIAGSGLLRATAVGDSAYARRLTTEAREFSLAGSELREGTDAILRLVTWVMVPTGVLLLWSQIVANESIASAVQGTVAGLSAMVPEGLVLLTSMALTAGVIRLARRSVLTRELAAIEGLARVDVLCVDKTGTLTEAGMRVVTVEPISAEANDAKIIELALAALCRLDSDPNPTMAAIAAAYPQSPGWVAADVAVFTSERRWSGATFADHGTWLLGAPEALLDTASVARLDLLRRHTERGERVVLLACQPAPLSGAEPAHDLHAVTPIALVCLAEQVKADVAETLAYFARQGVTVKVLSGDNPATVAAVAARAGLVHVGQGVDAATLPTDPVRLAEAVGVHTVIGRVGPEHKRCIVAALQQAGHTVAMTGDGVNDLLALKRADVGIAMGHGSAASRSVAQFVLLDGGFAALPAVVAEGRRVIANIERVAGLFVTKTVYALILALATGVARLPFPLLPRQLSLIGGLSIGIPGFLLALEANAARARTGFVRRVAAISVPAGVIAAASTFAAYADARSDGATLGEARTTATVVLGIVAGCLLALTARPFNRARVAMLAMLAALFAASLALPTSRRYFEFAAPPPTTWATAAVLAVLACAALILGQRVWSMVTARRPAPRAPDTLMLG